MPSDLQEDLTPTVSPTEAHQRVLTLLHDVIVEAAHRRRDELPGLVETLQDDVVMTSGGTSRAAYGWFAQAAWRYGDRHVHEVFLNADLRHLHPGIGSAESVLVTLLHEASHVWAQANGIKDTSRDGRYHNRRFAEIALTIGLQVEKDTRIGHCTPRLCAWARVAYDDLLGQLRDGLILVRTPEVDAPPPDTNRPGGEPSDTGEAGPTSETTTSNKYVFASCQCQDGRGRRVTIRVATGSWRSDAICCSICSTPFMPSL